MGRGAVLQPLEVGRRGLLGEGVRRIVLSGDSRVMPFSNLRMAVGERDSTSIVMVRAEMSTHSLPAIAPRFKSHTMTTLMRVVSVME